MQQKPISCKYDGSDALLNITKTTVSYKFRASEMYCWKGKAFEPLFSKLQDIRKHFAEINIKVKHVIFLNN